MSGPTTDPPFIGYWQLERKLGSGGFGYVTLWRNKNTNQAVAIKKCHAVQQGGGGITERQRERWQDEVRLMTSTIQNENIVCTVNAEPASFISELTKTSPPQMPLLVMEYCEAGDLRSLLNQQANCAGLTESEVRSILKSLRNAISYLHSLGITHRDIKPENIVLQMKGKQLVYKLIDLGYAKSLGHNSLAASFVGTMEYLAPELLQSDKYNCAVDYWSMGTVIFEVATGCRPFLPHLPPAEWMAVVKRKTSQHICITAHPDNDSYAYGTTLFPENQLSAVLRGDLESWLKMALEWNPKQRGFVFEKSTPLLSPSAKAFKFVDAKSDENAGPKQVLKIFTLIDEMLAKRVLSIFSLYTYAPLNVCITDSTTMSELKKLVALALAIPVAEIEFILPLEQDKIDRVTDETRPVDLYIADQLDRPDKPMLFVKRHGHLMYDDLKPVIPDLIATLLEKGPKKKLRRDVLKQFGRNAFHFVANENRLFRTLLHGFKNYALCLNDEIVKNRRRITEMQELSYGLRGKIEFYEAIVRQCGEKLIDEERETVETWDTNCIRMKTTVHKLNEATTRIAVRFESVLRRSREFLAHRCLREQEMDFFNCKTLKGHLNTLKNEINEKIISDKSCDNILHSVYECLKSRDFLLRNTEFKEYQQGFVDVKIELNEIKKVAEVAIQQTTKYNEMLHRMLTDHINSLWTLRVSSADFLPDIPEMLHPEQPQPTAVNFLVGGSVSSVAETSFVVDHDNGDNSSIQSVIDENSALIMATSELINECVSLITAKEG